MKVHLRLLYSFHQSPRVLLLGGHHEKCHSSGIDNFQVTLEGAFCVCLLSINVASLHVLLKCLKAWLCTLVHLGSLSQFWKLGERSTVIRWNSARTLQHKVATREPRKCAIRIYYETWTIVLSPCIDFCVLGDIWGQSTASNTIQRLSGYWGGQSHTRISSTNPHYISELSAWCQQGSGPAQVLMNEEIMGTVVCFHTHWLLARATEGDPGKPCSKGYWGFFCDLAYSEHWGDNRSRWRQEAAEGRRPKTSPSTKLNTNNVQQNPPSCMTETENGTCVEYLSRELASGVQWEILLNCLLLQKRRGTELRVLSVTLHAYSNNSISFSGLQWG